LFTGEIGCAGKNFKLAVALNTALFVLPVKAAGESLAEINS
jgi:hypothetical protein